MDTIDYIRHELRLRDSNIEIARTKTTAALAPAVEAMIVRLELEECWQLLNGIGTVVNNDEAQRRLETIAVRCKGIDELKELSPAITRVLEIIGEWGDDCDMMNELLGTAVAIMYQTVSEAFRRMQVLNDNGEQGELAQ